MNKNRVSASGDVNVTVIPQQSWDEKMAAVKENSLRVAKDISEQNHAPFVVKPLAPKEIQGGDTIPLSGVVIKLDWQVAMKLEMVESARDMITNAYILDSLDPAFPTVLRLIIEGKGLYDYSIGEFFQMYGRFEGKYQQAKHKDTLNKMKALVNGEKKYLKSYKEHGKSYLYPLPYAVRNYLAHTGHNPNTLDPEGKELRTSIELLRSWAAPER